MYVPYVRMYESVCVERREQAPGGVTTSNAVCQGTKDHSAKGFSPSNRLGQSLVSS